MPHCRPCGPPSSGTSSGSSSPTSSACPRAGDIVHATDPWEEPGGGGAVSAVQLARLAGDCTFYTALGDDERGAWSRRRLSGARRPRRGGDPRRTDASWGGVRRRERRAHDHHARPTPRTHDGRRPPVERARGRRRRLLHGRRRRRAPRGAPGAGAGRDEPRRRTCSPRPTCTSTPSWAAAADPAEALRPRRRSPIHPTWSCGPTGAAAAGTRPTTAGAAAYEAAAPPGPVVDTYGAGDSFAAGLTFALGAGLEVEEALVARGAVRGVVRRRSWAVREPAHGVRPRELDRARDLHPVVSRTSAEAANVASPSSRFPPPRGPAEPPSGVGSGRGRPIVPGRPSAVRRARPPTSSTGWSRAVQIEHFAPGTVILQQAGAPGDAPVRRPPGRGRDRGRRPGHRRARRGRRVRDVVAARSGRADRDRARRRGHALLPDRRRGRRRGAAFTRRHRVRRRERPAPHRGRSTRRWKAEVDLVRYRAGRRARPPAARHLRPGRRRSPTPPRSWRASASRACSSRRATADVGILTDRDLRTRVVAERRSGGHARRRGDDAREPRPSRADTMVGEVLLRMLEGGFHHFPIADDGRHGPRRRDRHRPDGDRPGHAVRAQERDRARPRSRGGRDRGRRAPRVVTTLVDASADPVDVGHVIAFAIDAATRRLLELGMAEHGEPPFPWAWLALGSAARQEQAIRTDQDHALAFEGDPDAASASLAAPGRVRHRRARGRRDRSLHGRRDGDERRAPPLRCRSGSGGSSTG